MVHDPASAQSLAGGYIYQRPRPAARELGGGFVEFLFAPSVARTYGYGARSGSHWSDDEPPQSAAPRDEDRVHLDFDRPARSAVETVRRPEIAPQFLPRTVAYRGPEVPGTIVVDTPNHFLFLVERGGVARRYGIGVGRPGFTWSGVHHVSAMREWPAWTPPQEMRRRQPYLPVSMPGGPHNPLGARALYLGSTLYRIHGSNEPWTIGHNVSSGCIRMRNADVIDLYERVRIGA
ncbi:MAG: L,D-transpeptidase, partial [Sphingomicrobium sp.]